MLAHLNGEPARCGVKLLLAALCLASTLAVAQPRSALPQRLADIGEIVRYVPERGLGMLLEIEAECRAADPRIQAEFLSQLGLARDDLGQRDAAQMLANELIAFGKDQHDNAAVATGMLNLSNIKYERNEISLGLQLVREAERIANTTGNMRLQVRARIAAAQTFVQEGNFPLALARLQSALTLARQQGEPTQVVTALYALADLFRQMREYAKGFDALDEATQLARNTNSPGRMATLKKIEYDLAIESKQPRRALNALLAALKLQREIGATSMTVTTLADLSDSYLRERDYPNTLAYANQAIEAARRLNDDNVVATARINIGQAYLGMGRLAEGKRSFDAGLAWYQKSGNKPELQDVMAEYGAALERAGDLAGALAAYHRERELSNELFEERRQKAMLELQEKYEAEKKQRQIDLLRGENQLKSAEIDHRRLQQRIWWVLALGFALASAIVGSLYRKVRHANALLEEKNLELKQQSSRDPLTSLYNRRHFQEFMRNHPQTEKRGTGAGGEEMVAALFLLDVDHFKQVNDNYGHAAGDALLKMLSDALHEILRETDMIVRWGGEEFLAFVPAVPRSGLDEVARRLLAGIASRTIDHQGLQLTAQVSIGYAPFPLAPGGVALTWERVVNLIDQALYLAKANGRNRAYGIRSFPNFGQTSVEDIEQDLERAWRAGFVDLSIMPGGWPALKASA